MANRKTLLLDETALINDFLAWAAKRGANKLYRKPIDILATNIKGGFVSGATKFLLDWSKDTKLTELLWKSEKEKQLEGIGVYVYDVITQNGEQRVVENWTTQMIDWNQVGGKLYFVEFIINKIEQKTETYYVSEIRDLDSNRFKVLDSAGKQVNLDETKNKELVKAFEELNLVDVEHNMGMVWADVSKNDPEANPISSLIKEELELYVSLMQKMYEEIYVNTTKVVGTDASLDVDVEGASEKKARNTFLSFAKRSVLLVESFSNEGTADSAVISANPAFVTYRDEINNVINSMLKKMGHATDVDSKGTVQQSKQEIVMAQGNEYEASEFRLNMRQNDLNSMMKKIKRIYTSYIKNTTAFKDVDNIQVLISQSEVLSETERLANLKATQELNLMNSETQKIFALAELKQISIYDAWKLGTMTFEAENE